MLLVWKLLLIENDHDEFIARQKLDAPTCYPCKTGSITKLCLKGLLQVMLVKVCEYYQNQQRKFERVENTN